MSNDTPKKKNPKQILDFIFIVCLICTQEIQDIWRGDVDREEDGSIFLTGAWSQLLMTVSWLQRLYSKAGLDDSPEVDVDMPEFTDRADGIELLIAHLELCLDKLESKEFEGPVDASIPVWIESMMMQNIYSGIYEAQVMLEYELADMNIENLNK